MIPYYFERLQNRKVFLSNLLGGWEIIEETPTLEYVNDEEYLYTLTMIMKTDEEDGGDQ